MRPDNDVLITRLLGRKIALILIHMQGNICHRLGAPTTTTRHAVHVSGRLTLASCCEQSSDTRAGGCMVAGCSGSTLEEAATGSNRPNSSSFHF